jgi:hypothetical protein
MNAAYLDLIRIVDSNTPVDRRRIAMRSFAERFDWTPSYEVEGSLGVEGVQSHIVVEHGLEYSAAITFLKKPIRAADISGASLRSLLAISYNNLIDWHFFISDSDIRRVNNLANFDIDKNADNLFNFTPNNTPEIL